MITDELIELNLVVGPTDEHLAESAPGRSTLTSSAADQELRGDGLDRRAVPGAYEAVEASSVSKLSEPRAADAEQLAGVVGAPHLFVGVRHRAETVDELRCEFHAAGIHWYVCRCGRKLYQHSARTIPSTGGREHVCGQTRSGRFEPLTLPHLDYSHEKGLHQP